MIDCNLGKLEPDLHSTPVKYQRRFGLLDQEKELRSCYLLIGYR